MYLLHILIIVMCFKNIITGMGGYITIINETESDWKLTEQKSTNMSSWTFPDLIKTRSIFHIYVESHLKLHLKSSEMKGMVTYTFGGAEDKKFDIQVANFKIIVSFHNISIDGKPDNDTIDLGWLKNDVSFVLVEYSGKFSGSGSNTTDWIRNNLEIFGKRTLTQVTIPGTHNSGMNFVNKRSTLLSDPCNILTQSYSIKGQLHFGVRYFDIRPVLDEGQFMTGHFEKIPGSWQGGIGQSIKSIIEEINEFANSRGEVIIVSLSHSLETDWFRKFNQSEWERLFDNLDRIERLFHAPGNTNITDLTIDELTQKGNRSAVIMEVREAGVELNERWGKGYFYPNSFKIYDVYSKTNDLVKMVEDQIIKMYQYSVQKYFLLSWTLTQNVNEAMFCPFRRVNSIKDNAKEVNRYLAYILYPQISPRSYPNIICVDDVKSTEVTALALAINKKLLRY